jgi:hypothetical protein
MFVFATPAAATFLAPEHVLAMGGAMFVAGLALLPGGNLIGLLLLVPGALIMLAGIRSRPVVERPEWIRLVSTAIALVVGVYLALDGGVITCLIALALAVVVTLVNSRY